MFRKWFLSITYVLVCTFQQDNASVYNNEKYLKMVLKNLNTTADPCENFFDYACGNWAANYQSEYYVDMPGYMEHLVNEQLLQVLRENRYKTGIYEQLWRYYRSCQELKNPALNSYLKLLQPELQFQWPIFREDWHGVWKNESNFDWLSTIAHLRVYGLNGVFLTQDTNVRLTNGSHYVVELQRHQPRLTLTLDSIASIFMNFGMTKEESQNVSMKIIELEELMLNLTSVEFNIEIEEDDMSYKNSFREMTIEELMQQVPQIDWIKYFSIVLNRPINTKTDTVQTYAFDVNYYKQLEQILAQTTNETISYYIMLKFMYQVNNDLPVWEDKTMYCVKHLRGYMPLAMNYLYEQHYYRPKRQATDAVLNKLFQKLRDTFEHIVAENHLDLNETERAFILAELRTMQLKIGNIPTNVSRTFVESYYSDIKINATNFYQNHLQLIKHNTRRQQERLRNQPIPHEMQFYVHDPETAGSSSPVKIFDNAILVPYGYLQLPLFDAALHPLLQYSLFGFIIAHEIIHAFDLFHIVYDQYGNYNDTGVSVAHHFGTYVDCFIRQLSDNLSENIADIAGLRLVYKAYFDDAVNSLHAENVLSSVPAMNITSEQLFFINSVQFLCANMEKISTLNTKSLNLEHDMHDIRVKRNWANFEQFALAFQCKKETIMNPTTRCRLW